MLLESRFDELDLEHRATQGGAWCECVEHCGSVGARSNACFNHAKRGFVPEDVRNFSPLALEIMRTASRHVCCLIDEGYDLKQSTTFVGNHYLLSERQRLAIMRCAATQAQIENRQKKLDQSDSTMPEAEAKRSTPDLCRESRSGIIPRQTAESRKNKTKYI